jgi:ArsR family transcriptional regulator, zinc-responsive transcriptional repressor
MRQPYIETESQYKSDEICPQKYINMCLYIPVSAAQQGYVAAGDLLRVLAAPARLAIVVELANEPLQVNELVERLELSQPLVSHHLRVLRGARLVAVERRGREATYSLVDQHVAHIVADAVQHSHETSRHDTSSLDTREVAPT